MTPIDLVRLTALRDRTGGSPDVVVGLIDGPVAVILSAKRASALPRFVQVVHLLRGSSRGGINHHQGGSRLYKTQRKLVFGPPRLADWQHAARPGPTFRGEIGIDAGDFLNNKRGLLAALVLREPSRLFCLSALIF